MIYMDDSMTPKKAQNPEEDGLAFKEEMFSEFEQEYGRPWNTNANVTEKPNEED